MLSDFEYTANADGTYDKIYKNFKGNIMTNKQYQDYTSKRAEKSHCTINCIKAFITGGFICTVAEAFFQLYLYLNISQETSILLASLTIILLTALSTGMGFFDKIKAGLTKTREALSNTLGSVFTGFSQIDDDFYDELEESLILSDVGVTAATEIVEQLREDVRKEKVKTVDEKLFFHIVKCAFGQRRKTLMNCLFNLGNLGFSKEELTEIIQSLGWDERIRGEALGLEEFAALTDRIAERKANK